MALTVAQRQAALKERKNQTLEELVKTNGVLAITVTELQLNIAELQAKTLELREQLHKSEISMLKAQLKNKS